MTTCAKILAGFKSTEEMPVETKWTSEFRPAIRRILHDAHSRASIVEELGCAARSFGSVDAIFAIDENSTVWGGYVAWYLSVPFGYISSKRWSAQVECFKPEELKGLKVLLVGDIVWCGAPFVRAAHILRNCGAEVVGMVAVFDYQFPEAKEGFANANIKMRTLVEFGELLKVAEREGYLKKRDLPKLGDPRSSKA